MAPVWQRLYQRWFEIPRVWAMRAGRADAGDEREQAELKAFAAHPLGIGASGVWGSMRAGLRAVFDSPEENPAVHDELIAQGGVRPLHDALGTFWNPRYEQAQRRR
ncbi:MAG: hypothetical protein JWO74_2458 [Solirubrobacterales bacterium]|nr:hypothetical protein [Solirubrobacterales bacterium]